MKFFLLSINILLLSVIASVAAVPDYKAFRGIGGITVTTNPPPGGDGTVVIDGSGISAGALPSFALTNNQTSAVTLGNNLNVTGTNVAQHLRLPNLTARRVMITDSQFRVTTDPDVSDVEVNMLDGIHITETIQAQLDRTLTNHQTTAVAFDSTLNVGSRIMAPNVLWTNVFYVNATNSSATINGQNLTNISTHMPIGGLLIVGPGNYYIPTNGISLLPVIGSMYCMPGVRIGSGTMTDNEARFLFSDGLIGVPITNNIYGHGQFFMTNNTGLGSVLYLQDANSKVTFQCMSASFAGDNHTIWVDAGELIYEAMDYTYADVVNAFNCGSLTSKIWVKSDKVYSKGPLIAAHSVQNLGDSIWSVRYAETLASSTTERRAFTAGTNVVMELGTVKFGRPGQCITTQYATNAVAGGIPGLIKNTIIYAYPDATNGVIESVPGSEGVFGNNLTFRNCTIYGPANVDPILPETSVGGLLTLENCTIVEGAGATNWIRAYGTLGTEARVHATGLKLARNLPAGTGVVVFTNYIPTSVAISGHLHVSGVTYSSVLYPSNTTVSRVAMIRSDGTLTNVAAGSAGQFLKSDGTSATPAGGSGTPAGTWGEVQYNSNGVLAAAKMFYTNDVTSVPPSSSLSIGTGRMPEASLQITNSSQASIFMDGIISGALQRMGVRPQSVGTEASTATGNTNWSLVAGGQGIATIKSSGFSILGARSLEVSNANLGRAFVTNALVRSVTNSTDTGMTMMWNGPDIIRWSPVGAGTLAEASAPSSGDPYRQKTLFILTDQSITWPATWRTRDTLPPVVLSGGVTNKYTIEWDGEETFVDSWQSLTTGTGPLAGQTNALLRATVIDTATITNGLSYILAATAGAGTGSTNVTAQANGARRQYLNAGLVNINFVAIMQGQATAHDPIVFIATNLTASVCTMTLGSATNNWINVGSLAAPFTITNALWFSTETKGTNVFYAARYCANPTIQ